jgi:hypothetical protein
MESDAGMETTGLSRLMGHKSTRTLQRYVTNTFQHDYDSVASVQDRIRNVRQAAEKGRKCATECATEIPEAKRTCDGNVASP